MVFTLLVPGLHVCQFAEVLNVFRLRPTSVALVLCSQKKLGVAYSEEEWRAREKKVMGT